MRACDAKGQAPEQHILKPSLGMFVENVHWKSVEISFTKTGGSINDHDQTYKSMALYLWSMVIIMSQNVTYCSISKNPPRKLMPQFRCTTRHLHSMEFWWLCQFQCLLFSADAGKSMAV